MLLVHERLVDLKSLHLSHRLGVALALTWLCSLLLIRTHCSDLRLQVRRVLIHFR